VDWCEGNGLDTLCDPCTELGWYGDGECDEALISLMYCYGPDPDCVEAVCGDGVLEGDEECDDGNTARWDGCDEDCTLGEDCDNGVDDDGDGMVDLEDVDCFDFPEPSFCGDGILDEGEECDDGNTEHGDGCAVDCTLCEECDNGVDDDGDGLTDLEDPECAFWPEEYCGDGNLNPGEECDDGNHISGDGCNADCTIGEQCDNGVDDDGDGMVDMEDTDCMSWPCGSICGDGYLECPEECDDGNTESGDGCDAVCMLEGSPDEPLMRCTVDADCPAIANDPGRCCAQTGGWRNVCSTLTQCPQADQDACLTDAQCAARSGGVTPVCCHDVDGRNYCAGSLQTCMAVTACDSYANCPAPSASCCASHPWYSHGVCVPEDLASDPLTECAP